MKAAMTPKKSPSKLHSNCQNSGIFSHRDFLNCVDDQPLTLNFNFKLGCGGGGVDVYFQNTLLSFVASVQISTGQLLRIGDWVEMRQQNADGFVIDIALHGAYSKLG